MGSDSDWPVVKGACTQLDALDIPYEAHILSAHRTPTQAAEFAKSARERGFGVVICAAGMAAHLHNHLYEVYCVAILTIYNYRILFFPPFSILLFQNHRF